MTKAFRRLPLGAIFVGLVVLFALPLHVGACISGNSGTIASSCTSSADCTLPYECLPITPAYTCSVDAGVNTVMTCQLTCTTNAQCVQLPTPPSYTCSPNLAKCAGTDNMELCLPQQ